MNRISTLSVALLATATPFSLMAASELEPVIVTATRTAQTVDESLAAVTVLSRNTIEQSGASNLMELLAGYPGIYVSGKGGAGTEQSIFLRGTNSDAVLVLIDGIKLGSATTGQPSFAHYPLSNIEKIEIVRGPRSAIYGSGAIGGVIQIFTTKGSTNNKTITTLGVGSLDTHKISITNSGSIPQLNYSFTASHFRTEGITSKLGESGTEADRDGYENNSFGLSLSSYLSDYTDISVQWMYANGEVQLDDHQYDAPGGAYSDTLQQSIGTTLNHQVSEHWDSKLKIGYVEDLSQTYDSNPSTIDTYRTSATWQNDLYIDDNTITLGVDHTQDKISSTKNYSNNRVQEDALFGQYQTKTYNGDWLLAFRHIDNNSFGSHNTGNIEYGTEIFDHLRVTAAYGEAFHAPDINDLYWPVLGNTSLSPETSKTYEIGFRFNIFSAKWKTSLYRTTIKNLIEWADSGSDLDGDGWDDWIPSNVGKARIKGIEVEAETSISGWDSLLSLSYIDHKDTTVNKRLIRRPMWSYRAAADKQYNEYTFGLALHGQSSAFDDKNNTRTLGGYTLVDTYIRYMMNPQTTLNATVTNLSNRQYTHALDSSTPRKAYNAPDRELMLSVNYEF